MGDIILFKSDETNDFVLIGPQKFRDESDPAVAAMYVAALESLQYRRLVKYDGGDLYVLRGTGFKVARAFTATNDSADSSLQLIPTINQAESARQVESDGMERWKVFRRFIC